MKNRRWRFALVSALPLLAAGAYSCGSTDGGGADGLPAGSDCDTGSDCSSDMCEGGECVGNDPGGTNRPSGQDCDEDGQCASGSCSGVCDPGSDLDDGQA